VKSAPLGREFLESQLPRLLEDQVDLISYRRDASVYPAGRPQAAFRATSTDEVVQVVKIALQRKLPVYVWGAGSTYAGGVNPSSGGIALDVSPMNRILAIDRTRAVVLVEPGVTYGALLEALRPHGLTVGIVPLTGPSGTVGGTISSHGLGTGSPRFQGTGDEVAGLEVVLADGEILCTGSAVLKEAGFFQRYAVGPDLTGLFLGANGAFGVITKIALWTHPIPAHVETMALGFADYPTAANFIAHCQERELFRNVWYGAGYDKAAVAARIAGAAPAPDFCLGLDLRGEPEDVAADRRRLTQAARGYGGDEYPIFNDVFFSKLRRDFSFWYGYAGYFSRSMCALLMTSMESSTMPRFFALLTRFRADYPEFTWGAGTVLCRRGLHGAVIMFYDEQRQWEAARQACIACCEHLLRIGCVPYKTGKVWASLMDNFPAYFKLLQKLKTALDPQRLLAPDNLAL
jgi:FAD/FMN-containing dehydrogenase